MNKFLDFLRNHRIITTLLSIFLVTIVLFIALNIWLYSYTRHNDVTQLPSVKYLTVDEAAEILHRHGMKYEIMDSVYNEKAEPGIVMDQIPAADSKIKEGRVIYLTINAFSPRTIRIPNHLINSSARQAKAQLASIGFKKIEIEYEESPYKDLVLSIKNNGRHVAAGDEVPASSTIVLVVGKGLEEEDEYVSKSDTIQEEVVVIEDDFFF